MQNHSMDDAQSMESWTMMGEEVPALQTAVRCLHSSIGANIVEPGVSTHVAIR
jgi:hypothetical protein